MMRLLLAITLFVAACGGASKSAPMLAPATTDTAVPAPEAEPTEGGSGGPASDEGGGGTTGSPAPAAAPTSTEMPAPSPPPKSRGLPKGGGKKSEDPCAGGE